MTPISMDMRTDPPQIVATSASGAELQRIVSVHWPDCPRCGERTWHQFNDRAFCDRCKIYVDAKSTEPLCPHCGKNDTVFGRGVNGQVICTKLECSMARRRAL